MEFYDDVPQIVHPHHVRTITDNETIVRFEPVYPLTSGVSQKLMFGTVDVLLKNLPELGEWIDPNLLKEEIGLHGETLCMPLIGRNLPTVLQSQTLQGSDYRLTNYFHISCLFRLPEIK